MPARLTVVETVYHQIAGQQPDAQETRFVRELETDEQPYGPRRLKARGAWEDLDTGWLGENVSMVTIRNDEGTRLQATPSPEEALEMAGRVIELTTGAMADAHCVVLPGQSTRIFPGPGIRWQIRCQSGEARYTLTAYPR